MTRVPSGRTALAGPTSNLESKNHGDPSSQTDNRTPSGGSPASGAGQSLMIPRGDHLFREGHVPGAMYLIRRGSLRISRTEGGRKVDLEVLDENQIVGELSFLDEGLRSASAQALCDTTVVKISGPVFAKTLEGLPDWLKVLIRSLCLRLRTVNTKIRARDE
ncbi:MAG: cyclic nucleotide-binding domain-containing protein [Verrucomicrobia bacterium]|nr:cyclic nucleotide-binding domain-containing protein [Verrucomicrobiota bacterium]